MKKLGRNTLSFHAFTIHYFQGKSRVRHGKRSFERKNRLLRVSPSAGCHRTQISTGRRSVAEYSALFVALAEVVSWTVHQCWSEGAGSEGGPTGRRKKKKGPAWTAAGRRVNRDNLGRMTEEVVSNSRPHHLKNHQQRPQAQDTSSIDCNRVHSEKCHWDGPLRMMQPPVSAPKCLPASHSRRK